MLTFDKQINVNLATRYSIDLYHNWLSNSAAVMNTLAPQINQKKTVIISDSNVAKLYGNTLATILHCPIFTFPAGEAHKTRQQKAQLEDQLLQQQFHRDTLVIAIGGGVVTDLAGYLAATFHRGIPVVYIPTTTLAIVDAAIGGKTGINTEHGKNTIGAFKQPQKVIIDLQLLRSLTAQQWQDGLVETTKHALIADSDFFSSLSEVNTLATLEQNTLADVLIKSLNIKRKIIEKDEQESHCRKTLNLGHTLGHAIEKYSQYQISHGQAVQLGIELESFIAVKRGLLPESQFSRIQQQLHRLIQPRIHFDSQAIGDIIQLARQDKKNQQQQIHCCLLSNIGQVYRDNGNYTTAVTQEEIRNALQWFTQRELTTC
jgi:3-dehydroquinate synthase